MGSKVLLRLYRPRDGRKEYIGVLKDYQDGTISLEVKENTMTFTPEEVAMVRLYAEF